MKKSDIPCKPDCPKRSWDCHAKCPEYAEYKMSSDEERERNHKIRVENALLRQEEIRRNTRGRIK
jgi:hypothetical protein